LRKLQAVVEQQKSDQRAFLRSLRLAGQLCYRMRDYRCALLNFQWAFRLSNAPGLLFNIASSYDKLGMQERSVDGYLCYLRREPMPPPHVLGFIKIRLAVLLPSLASSAPNPAH
jgi:hypothetical protein